MFDVYSSTFDVFNDGVRIKVTDHGPRGGEPLILIHGFPDSAFLWRNQIPVLIEAGYRVLAPDLRGFGDSDKPAGAAQYRMSVLASDIDAVLESAEVQSAHVIGHDWGAGLSWYLAITRPDVVRSLTAISVGHPLAFKDAGMRQMARSWYMILFQFEGVAEEWLMRDDWAAFRTWSMNATDLERWVGTLSEPGALASALNIYRANMSPAIMTAPAPELPPVQSPVMGVWSSNDMALVEEQMTGSERYVGSDFRYERLDGVSHWIPVDAPQALNALLLDWLGSQ